MSKPPRSFEAAQASVTGERACNQDRCLLLSDAETVLLGVADGLGGHPRGEAAAQLFVDVSTMLFRQAPKPLGDPEHFMLQCIGKAHHAIVRFGLRQDPPVAPRTTAVLAVVQRGIAYWTHVGDSRLYLIRDGAVHAKTRDHAQVTFVRQAAAQPSRPRASLTRCLGGLPRPPTTTCGPPTLLQAGDTLMLCSDGLWGQLPSERLVEGLDSTTTDIQSCVRGLVEQAAASPRSDNVSAVALRWLDSPAAMPDQAGLLEPPQDPLLDQAIQHLQRVLQQTDEPKPEGN